jgi:hypothetical protein
MISAHLLLGTLRQILDQKEPKNFNAENIASQLAASEQAENVQLSEYGYIMYVLEHAGLGGIYHGRLADPLLIKGYASEARKHKEDMPTLLVNARRYAEKVFQVVQDPDMCMPRLEGMSFPYVLFVLFTALGQHNMVNAYRTETKELLARYPGTLDALPDNIKNATLEALNADSQ